MLCGRRNSTDHQWKRTYYICKNQLKTRNANKIETYMQLKQCVMSLRAILAAETDARSACCCAENDRNGNKNALQYRLIICAAGGKIEAKTSTFAFLLTGMSVALG